MKRRTLLKASLAFGAASLMRQTHANQGRAIIVGGGWGGLAAARQLKLLAPALDITLIERNGSFWSHPLSNRWLVGLADGKALKHDYHAAAQKQGYRFLQAEVLEIDRQQRTVTTSSGKLGYDWLTLATGIGEDFSAWYGVDRDAGAFTRQHFPSAFCDNDGHQRLKAKLENFKGGDLVMTIPAAPYRCPPAPYERAGMIAWWMKTRRIKGRLIVLDPNLPALGFDRVFRDSYREQISYLPQAQVKQIDPYKKRIVTDFETIDFDDAILMPPQQASGLIWRAGLIAQDKDGRPTGWAAHDPVHLHVPGDERVFLVGDILDKSSPLFGYYPKTGQLAARLGQIAARQIAARASEQAPPKLLPDSSCHILNRVEPMEIARLDTSYRLRGDGLIQQTVKQSYDPQPDNNDIRWAQAMFAELGLQSDTWQGS